MRYITPDHCIASRLEGRPAPSWPVALLVFRDHPASQKVLKAFPHVRPVRYRLLYNMTSPDFEPFVFEADTSEGTIVVVTRCVWGGPQVAILVEELAALGARFLVGYGIAGSIDPDLPPGHLVLAASAVTSDGTSKAYGALPDLQAHADLIRAGVAAAAKTGCEIDVVTAATIDALYRETPAVIDDLRGRGAQIINLETSPFYAASEACGIQSIWLGYVSDHLKRQKWQDWYTNLGDASEKALGVCRGLLAAILCEQGEHF